MIENIKEYYFFVFSIILTLLLSLIGFFMLLAKVCP